MGYRTVLNVPSVSTHAEALEILKDTKPIRGTTTVPLGDRRDHHQYSIRKEGEDIQLVCYRTPVVTFHPDDTITIKTDGWCSVSTHQFITQVTGMPTNGRGGFTVIRAGGSVVSIRGNETASFKREDGNWHCFTQISRPSYRINRKGANNVRARYKEFADYIKGFSKVRAELFDWRKETKPYKIINFTHEELEAVMPKDVDGDLVWRGTDELMDRRSKNHMERGEEMIGWVTSGDHEQYFKAALFLYAGEYMACIGNPNKQLRPFHTYAMRHLSKNADLGPRNFDEFILRWHAEEVIEACETKPNAVPNMKYAAWLTPKRTEN